MSCRVQRRTSVEMLVLLKEADADADGGVSGSVESHDHE